MARDIHIFVNDGAVKDGNLEEANSAIQRFEQRARSITRVSSERTAAAAIDDLYECIQLATAASRIVARASKPSAK